MMRKIKSKNKIKSKCNNKKIQKILGILKLMINKLQKYMNKGYLFYIFYIINELNFFF